MSFFAADRTRRTRSSFRFFFFFNDTATTEIYTLSLHDALPISGAAPGPNMCWYYTDASRTQDRKSTRPNSSHVRISYAVFCLKKKKKIKISEGQWNRYKPSYVSHAYHLLE